MEALWKCLLNCACVNFIILIIWLPKTKSAKHILYPASTYQSSDHCTAPCDCVSVIFVYCVCPKNRTSIASLSLSPALLPMPIVIKCMQHSRLIFIFDLVDHRTLMFCHTSPQRTYNKNLLGPKRPKHGQASLAKAPNHVYKPSNSLV